MSLLKVLEEGHTQGVQDNSKGREDRTAHAYTHAHKSTWHPHNTSPQLPTAAPLQPRMVYTSFPSIYKECPFSLPSTSLIPKMPQEPGLKVTGVGGSPRLTQTFSGGFHHPPCPLSICFQRSNSMALCEVGALRVWTQI